MHGVVRKHVKHVILFGKDADLLQQSLAGAAEIHLVDSMRAAVQLASNLAVPGDNVLLSPACASFDMYANYMQRGDDFEHCVKEIAT